jgi:transcriptional regulator with GAF, ATPase, and Fis domain
MNSIARARLSADRRSTPAHRHHRHRHADELPLAGQRARAGELPGARGARLRRGRHPRPPPAPTLQTAEVSGTLPRVALESAVESYEKDLILDALKTARGNRARAARLLDTTERIVGYKVRQYGIHCSRFRSEPRPRGSGDP